MKKEEAIEASIEYIQDLAAGRCKAKLHLTPVRMAVVREQTANTGETVGAKCLYTLCVET